MNILKNSVRNLADLFGYKITKKAVSRLNRYNFTRSYYLHQMNIIQDKYGFEQKIVCEIGSDPNLECARGAMLLGAKECHCYNYGINLDDVGDNAIKIHKYHFGMDTIPENYFDLIFGIAVLEHIDDIEKFALNIIKALKTRGGGGMAYLQGEPVWTSALGHHLWVITDKAKYQFNDSSNFLDDWYHLSMPTKDSFERYLLLKGVESDIIPQVWEWLYENNAISRKSSTEIIEAFKNLKGCNVEIRKDFYHGREENCYFEIARKMYTEEELRTSGLGVFIQKNNVF